MSGENEIERRNFEEMDNNESEMTVNHLFFVYCEFIWDDVIEKMPMLDRILFGNSLTIMHKYLLTMTEPSILKKPRYNLKAMKFKTDSIDQMYTVDWQRIFTRLKSICNQLINAYDDINFAGSNGDTLLHSLFNHCLEVQDFSYQQLAKLRHIIKTLIELGASAYKLNKLGKSPIHLAVTCKNQQVALTLISCLWDVRECDLNGDTALHTIVKNCIDDYEMQHRYKNLVERLICKGADINRKNQRGLSVIHIAADKLQYEILDLLGKYSGDFNQTTFNFDTPLHVVCGNASSYQNTQKAIRTIETLINRGCIINTPNMLGYTALHQAVKFSSVEIVAKLIELGAKVESRTAEQLVTPLHLAAKNGCIDVMKILVEAGANVNAEAGDGATPLFMTAFRGSEESMSYLIEQRANFHKKDYLHGYSMLHMAVNGDQMSDKVYNFLIGQGLNVDEKCFCGISPLQMAIISRNTDAVRTLICNGADIHYQAHETEYSPLHLATLMRHYESVEMLIKAGAKVNYPAGPEGLTPLQCLLATNFNWSLGKYPDETGKCNLDASPIVRLHMEKKKNEEKSLAKILILLISNHADVNAKDRLGRAALHFAAMSMNITMVSKLLNYGARTDAQDNAGDTAIMIALRKHDHATLKELLAYGADVNDHNVLELVTYCTPKEKELLFHYVVLMKIIGCPITPFYETGIRCLPLAQFNYMYMKEMNTLQQLQVDKDISIIDFLRMKYDEQIYYVEKVRSMLPDITIRCPVYSFLIEAIYRRIMHRQILLDLAENVWDKVRIPKLGIPEKSRQTIMAYWSNRYLETFVDAGTKHHDILIDNTVIPVITGLTK